MNSLKFLAAAFTAFFLFTFNASAQSQSDTASEIVLVRTYEALEDDFSSYVFIAYGGSTTEVVRLEMPIFGGANAKINTTRISAALAKVAKMGYTLTNTTYLNNVDVVVTTYLFTKNKR